MRHPTARTGSLSLVAIAAVAIALDATRTRLARVDADATLVSAASAFDVEPEVIAMIVGDVAEALREDEALVLEDLLGISANLPRPVELSDVTAAYVVQRRERNLGRAEAVLAAREQLATDAALRQALAK